MNDLALYSSLTIDLDAISDNYIFLQKAVGSSKCAAVLKADAYGLGASMVAPVLYDAGCRHFFIAYSDEGLELHNALGARCHDATIYVLNGPYLPGWPAYFHRYHLTPVINTLEDLETWHQFAIQQSTIMPTAVHIDTGMQRLGMPLSDFKILQEKQWPMIQIEMVMSHLSCADDPTHPSNIDHRSLFQTITTNYPNTHHSLSNSSGIFLGKDYHFTMVRTGMALYGLNPTPYQKNVLQQCIHVKTRILQIQYIQSGSMVGYGQTFKAKQPMRLATLAVGYADGFSWRMSGQNGYVVINGKKAPIVGRISMDLVNVDITQIPSANVGDWAEIINNNITVDDHAQKAGIINYELLLNLGKRFKKVYSYSKTQSSIEATA